MTCLTSCLVGGVETLEALGLIPRLAAAETMDIEGTEMGHDWRAREGGREEGMEGGREGGRDEGRERERGRKGGR